MRAFEIIHIDPKGLCKCTMAVVLLSEKITINDDHREVSGLFAAASDLEGVCALA